MLTEALLRAKPWAPFANTNKVCVLVTLTFWKREAAHQCSRFRCCCSLPVQKKLKGGRETENEGGGACEYFSYMVRAERCEDPRSPRRLRQSVSQAGGLQAHRRCGAGGA